MMKMMVVVAILVGTSCSKSEPAKAPPPNWWCNARYCHRDLGECNSSGKKLDADEATCRANTRALCAMLRDATHGAYPMCFPTIERCMEMIEITEFAYENELSKTQNIEPKFRKLTPEEALKKCEDKT